MVYQDGNHLFKNWKLLTGSKEIVRVRVCRVEALAFCFSYLHYWSEL